MNPITLETPLGKGPEEEILRRIREAFGPRILRHRCCGFRDGEGWREWTAHIPDRKTLKLYKVRLVGRPGGFEPDPDGPLPRLRHSVKALPFDRHEKNRPFTPAELRDLVRLGFLRASRDAGGYFHVITDRGVEALILECQPYTEPCSPY